MVVIWKMCILWGLIKYGKMKKKTILVLEIWTFEIYAPNMYQRSWYCFERGDFERWSVKTVLFNIRSDFVILLSLRKVSITFIIIFVMTMLGACPQNGDVFLSRIVLYFVCIIVWVIPTKISFRGEGVVK